MHPYSHNCFMVDNSKNNFGKKIKVKCLIFGPNGKTKRMIIEHIEEVESSVDLFFGEDSSLQRRDLIAQYLAYHQPGWVVYIADVQTDRS